jgi:hypothetical protein
MARPTKITPIVVQKLEEAFALGCTDEEACIYADICKQTLYNFQEKNQGFLDRKELLKSKPVLQARQAVIKSFSSNPNLAMRFLERKNTDEFSLRIQRAADDPKKTRSVQIVFDKVFENTSQY